VRLLLSVSSKNQPPRIMMTDMDTDELLAAYAQWERAADALVCKREMLELQRCTTSLPAAALAADIDEVERLHARWLALSAPLVARRA
jgi:hypothetical protein